MAIRVGINGFGRIGRNILRAALHDKDVEFVAVNDITDAKTLAHLLKYDSILGNLPDEVKAEGDAIHVAGRKVKVLAIKDPGAAALEGPRRRVRDRVHRPLHRRRQGQGAHHGRRQEGHHLRARQGRGPHDRDGRQPRQVRPARAHTIVSNASCTTNCLAPVAKVLNDTFGIVKRPDDDRPLLHERPEDPRPAAQGPAPRARGGAVDDPDLHRRGQGDLPGHPGAEGQARRRRHPRADAERLARRPHGRSWRRRATAEEINAAFKKAAAGPMKGILDVTDEELVSIDFRGNPHSSIVDAPLTKVVDGNLAKVFSWYDNEWGFSNRMQRPAPLHGQARPRRSGCPWPRQTDPRPARTCAARACSCASTTTCRSRAARITDDTRIRASLPTLEHLLRAAARGWCSPRTSAGPRRGPTPEFSLKPVAARLSELLGVPVTDGARLRRRRGRGARREASRDGGVLLLENVRFHPEEEKNDAAFAARLVADSGATVFVNDAFGTAHRAHASTEGVSHHVKTSRGRPPDGEGAALPRHGARGAGAALRGRARRRQGLGQDRGHREPAAARGRAARRRRHGLHVPPRPGARHAARAWSRRTRSTWRAALLRSARRQDRACRSTTWWRPRSRRTPSTARCPSTEIARRAGWASTSARSTARAFADEAGRAKLVLWNGPMGVFEMEPFAEGTLAMAQRAGRQHGHHDRGRRRQRRGGHADGPGRQDRPRLDRRRRVARVPERRAAARRRLPARRHSRCDDRCIAGNWKMYKTAGAGGGARARDVRDGATGDVDVVVAPPFTALHRGRGRAAGQPGRAGRAEHALGGRGRLHRRGLAARCCATSAART